MNNPSEIAREAFRQLALQKIPPTPDNYRTLYARISGVKDTGSVGEFDPLKQLGLLVAALPRTLPVEEKLASVCIQLQEKQQWDKLIELLAKTLTQSISTSNLPWTQLVGRLVERWDSRLAGLTSAQKKTALERVLATNSSNEKLFEKLQGLVTQWGEKATAEKASLTDGEPESLSPADPPAGEKGERPNADLTSEMCANILDTIVASAVSDSPNLVRESKALAQQVRNLSAKNAGDLLSGVRKFAVRIEYFVEDQQELKTGLLHLLQLVVDNIGELVIDDRWLAGQVEVLRTLVAGPMNIRALDSAERRLKEVIYKQSHLKQGLVEAQSTIKALLAGFVGQLSSFAQSTGAYHEKIDLCAKRIGDASDISQLENVINDVMRETLSIQVITQKMHDELLENRARVLAAESKIATLEKELSNTSEMMRHDQLTGALNRRGLEEVFEKEIARAKRQQSPLCLGVLDIDNFKKLNDSLGHDAGDAALMHLVSTLRNALRPQDTVARFGGEEFVVLLPDTDLEEAKTVLVRVQRELTKHYFLHDNQKVLITFSAGVTQLPADETREHAIKRADELMYQAKNTGKNKVVAA